MKATEGTIPDSHQPRAESATSVGGVVRAARSLVSNPTARKGFLSLVDQGVVSATSFVTSVIIARSCSQDALGIYYLALSVVLLVRGVQGRAITAPYMVYWHRRRGPALASYAGSTLVHQLFLSLVTVACLVGLLGALGLGVGPSQLAPAVWALIGAVPFILLRDYVCHIAFAHLRVLAALAIDLTVALLQVGSLLLLARLEALSVVNVYLVIGTSCAVVSLGWLLTKQQPLRFVPSRVLVDWRHNWAFAKWALASKLVGEVTPYLMPWILVFTRGSAATGVLAACVTLVGVCNVFVGGLDSFLGPKAAHTFANRGVDALRRVLSTAAALFVSTLGAIFLVFLLSGDTLAVFVYGSEYGGTGPILAVLALNVLVNSLGVTAGNGLWAIDRPRANFGADACNLVVTLAAALWLVPSLGVLGAATAMLAGTAVSTAVRCATLVRWLRLVQPACAASPLSV